MHDPKDSDWNRTGFGDVRSYEWHAVCKEVEGQGNEEGDDSAYLRLQRLE
jgi:hypothetical protein